MTDTAIERKSLLYRSKVEYGGWTANHVQGCGHGCRYPCYAMMLAKRTGRIRTYEEWMQPRPVSNAEALLDTELRRFGHRVDNVHFSFTTDPFMYDSASRAGRPEICNLTLRLLLRLDEAGIPATTLTKGVYPLEVSAGNRLHPLNRYGISLVSLSDGFRSRWESGAASPSDRIASLEAIARAGRRTWVSIEPYPTPNIDPSADCVEKLLEAVGFADVIVFGKWNYSRLATEFDREHGFYADIAARVRSWCMHRDKTLHVKKGTPTADDTVEWSVFEAS